MPYDSKSKKLEHNRRYLAEHREQMREYHRAYRAAHRDQINAQKRAAYRAAKAAQAPTGRDE